MRKLIFSLLAVVFFIIIGCAHNTRLTYSKTYPINQNDTVWSRINSYVYNNRIPVVSENQYVIATKDYVISREISSDKIKIIITGIIQYDIYGIMGEPTPYSLNIFIDNKIRMTDILKYAETGKSATMEDQDIPENIQQIMR